MTDPTCNLSLRDRNILRAQQNECLENFHLQNLAEIGDVELLEQEWDLDDSSFPYPFQKMGKQKVYLFELTTQGMDRFIALCDSEPKNVDAYQESFRHPLCVFGHLFGRQQLRFSRQGIIEGLNFGDRDKMLVSNKRLETLSVLNALQIAIDPDTKEPLLTEEALFNLNMDDENIRAKF